MSGDVTRPTLETDPQTENFPGAPPSRRGFTYFQQETTAVVSSHIPSAQIDTLRNVLSDLEQTLESLDLDDCDIGDVRELIDTARAELERSDPNPSSLGTYLNSLARSMRSQSQAHTAVLELDAAMRAANVPTTWDR